MTISEFVRLRKAFRLSQCEAARLARVSVHRLHLAEHRAVELTERELDALREMFDGEGERLAKVMDKFRTSRVA